MKQFATAVISPPECDNLVVEGRYKESPDDQVSPEGVWVTWAEINLEKGIASLVVYATDTDDSIAFTLEEFERGYAALKKKAEEVFGMPL